MLFLILQKLSANNCWLNVNMYNRQKQPRKLTLTRHPHSCIISLFAYQNIKTICLKQINDLASPWFFDLIFMIYHIFTIRVSTLDVLKMKIQLHRLLLRRVCKLFQWSRVKWINKHLGFLKKDLYNTKCWYVLCRSFRLKYWSG